jgi:hypothetical protein
MMGVQITLAFNSTSLHSGIVVMPPLLTFSSVRSDSSFFDIFDFEWLLPILKKLCVIAVFALTTI